MSADTTDEELECRMSSYDNVDYRGIPKAPPSETSDMSEFSDSWVEIMNSVTNIEAEDVSFYEPQSIKSPPITRTTASRLQKLRSMDQGRAIGTTIRNYVLELANEKSTIFAQKIDNFIACTKDSREDSPQVVMRNMRQFMTGMKSYLVTYGEKRFHKKVRRERRKLKSTEFLDLDDILEGVLHCLIISPLKNHLHKLFIDKYTKTGDFLLLAENIEYANTRPISELAIEPKITLPNEAALQTIQQYLNCLQAADSPLEKLDYLLAVKTAIFNSVKITQLNGSGRNIVLGADDFLPLFVWVLIKTNFVAAEIEAEYMWGLLHPDSLSGEGGYYLTTLSSVVHVLKNFKESGKDSIKNNWETNLLSTFENENTPPTPPPRRPNLSKRQNNCIMTTTITLSVNSGLQNISPDHEVACDPKKMSPEGQTSTMSSKGSLKKAPENVTSPNDSVLSTNSDPNNLISPDTLSPLSVAKTRSSKREKQNLSKHYQESDNLDSPTVYYRNAVRDKIRYYEDLRTNENNKSKN